MRGNLIGLSFAGIVDTFWNGMGTGLLVVGVLHLVKFYRLDKNPAYREKNEIELNDERNRFLRNKAWAWAGYLFVMLAAVCSIIFKIVDQELLDKCGGIIQGMSGSPIIQDGKLVGAVTHVLVNDPTRGYGIFIENMLEAAD